MPEKSNQIGVFAATSYIIGCMIGSGIFITPTSVLIQAGSVGLSLMIWAAGGVVALIGALSFVELGTSIRENGCDYAYLTFVNWNPVAFAFIWINFIVHPCSVAVVAQTFGEYMVKALSPVFCFEESARNAVKKLLAFCLLWILTWINFFSLKKYMGPFQTVMAVAKLTPMLMIFGAGLYYMVFEGWTEAFEARNIMEGSKYEAKYIVLGMYGCLWSYTGWECLNFGTEDIKNPKRTLPLAIIGGCFLVTVCYVSVNAAYFTILSTDEMLESHAIAVTFCAKVLGPLVPIVPLLMAVVLAGTLNAFLFIASRYFFATARNGHMPTFLSVMSPETGSPRAAVLITSTIGIIISIFVGDLDTLINVYQFCLMFQRIFTMMAILWIRFKKIPVADGAIRMPIIMHVLFMIICIFLSVVTIIYERDVAIAGLVATAVGFLSYFVIFRIPMPKCLIDLNENTTRWTENILLSVRDRKVKKEELDETHENVDKTA